MHKLIRRTVASLAALAVLTVAASSSPGAAAQSSSGPVEIVITTDGAVINLTYQLGGQVHDFTPSAGALVNAPWPAGWSGEGRLAVTAHDGCRILVNGHQVDHQTGSVVRCAYGPHR